MTSARRWYWWMLKFRWFYPMGLMEVQKNCSWLFQTFFLLLSQGELLCKICSPLKYSFKPKLEFPQFKIDSKTHFNISIYFHNFNIETVVHSSLLKHFFEMVSNVIIIIFTILSILYSFPYSLITKKKMCVNWM